MTTWDGPDTRMSFGSTRGATMTAETVVTIYMDQFSCSFNINDDAQAKALIDELRAMYDGSYMPDETDGPNESLVRLSVRRMPAGHVASLPEFAGW